MASILNVDQINNAAGTSGLTLDASTGKASFPNGATLPAGSVVQVSVGTKTSQTSLASTTLTDTGLTASITPTSSSNKILVFANITGAGVASGDGVKMKLFRDATDLGFISSTGSYSGTGTKTDLEHGWSVSVLDTPSTTSSVTYKVQHAATTSGTVYICGGNSISTITLMEIAQ